MSDLLTVPDDDDTRLGLIHAFAYAEGIRREDVPRVPAEARRRWENRADRALTELRILSAAYAAGQAGRDVCPRCREPYTSGLCVLYCDELAATLRGTTDDPEGAPR